MNAGVKRAVYLTLAALFFVLGCIGIVLPVLPTTPFLLLTSYFLVRSSPRLNERLLRSRLFGPILRDWQERGGVRLDVKIQAISVVLLFAGLTLWMRWESRPIVISVVLFVAVGIVVIACLPTVRDPDVDSEQEATE